MRLLDDLAAPQKSSPGRRRFLLGITLGGIGTAALGAAVVSLRYLWPSVLFEAPSRFRAARIGELLRNPVQFLRDRRLYVIRDDEGVYAMSAVCTHLGCLTRLDPKGEGFFCPCHGSRFDLNGKVLKGPAPRPLPHYEVEAVGESVWVDTGKQEEADARLPA